MNSHATFELPTLHYVLALQSIVPLGHQTLRLSNLCPRLRPFLVLSIALFMLLLPNVIVKAGDSLVANVFGKVFSLITTTKFVNVGLRWSNKGLYEKSLSGLTKLMFLRPDGKSLKKSDDDADIAEKKRTLKEQARRGKRQRTHPLLTPVSRLIANVTISYIAINYIYLYFRSHPARPHDGTITTVLLHNTVVTNRPLLIQSYLYAFGIYLAMNILYIPLATLFCILLGSSVDSVPPVHNMPFLATSLRDFWNRRWNVLTKGELRDLVYLPVLRGLGCPEYVKDKVNFPVSPWKHLVAGMATFIYSGLMHEYIMWMFFGKMDGEQLAFFTLQGVGVCLEVGFTKLLARLGFNRFVGRNSWWAGRIWAMAWLLWTSPLFLNGFVRAGILEKWKIIPLFI
ncbi:uncharacterized protein SPPG_04041 [Spizellomyces punctatus DAOM BR117]|uniref:Wax synthase domain-containing protein n=1 Tax=Spizellomyces punctatus (strain DAOM BR117) TaxID=645134 RepID=A0A0L0HJ64_SPIPD|nr:uncharacterized protein SPPG_04041 [Spizellomyces punctatus DAOM BR117]KND00940.1 hypothetical protein SPPG_04041 [Spizellomyces punctatus DAOM BR117]|eukprot:XP_016608979.1 hypothetical protein SPPG_04041 [Spizellomyces punctatus DAOM BR117]